MARALPWRLAVAVLLALAVCGWAAEEGGEEEAPAVDEAESAEGVEEGAAAVPCALEWGADDVLAWYTEMSADTEKETYAALLKDGSVDGAALEAMLSDAAAADEALTEFGFAEAGARTELVDAWKSKKEETCEPEEVLDPKYSLPPLTMGASLACSACTEVVNLVWDEVTAVKPDVEDKSLKQRREAAHKIVDDICSKIAAVEVIGDKYEETFLVHKKPKKKKKKKKSKKKSKKTDEEDADAAEGEDVETDEDADAPEAADADAEEADAEAEAEEADGDDAEEEAEAVDRLLEAVGNPEDTATLQEACTLMMANHGLKLKSKLAGFYKETTKDGIRKKMCFQWEDLCYAAPKPKLKKREKCLMKAFKAIQNQQWEMAAKYTACAKKALKVKRKKSTKEDEEKAEAADKDAEPEVVVDEPSADAEGDATADDEEAQE